MTNTGSALIVTAFVTAFLHTVIPDHWLPFVIIGKDQNWGLKKTVMLSAFSSAIHVVFSVGLGAMAFLAGKSAAQSLGEKMEPLLSIFLIVFGLGYIFWDWKWGHHCHHHHGKEGYEGDDHLRWAPVKSQATGITIAIVLGISPCVILVPLLTVSVDQSFFTTFMVATGFSLSTIITMVVMTALGYKGIEKLHFTFMEKYGGLITGLILILMGTLFLLHPHIHSH